jgi:LysM repeat protein
MRFFIVFITLAFVAGYANSSAQFGRKITREEYILTYKDVAINEMNRSGIPASITLAQGMLESDNGNSTLANKANNHFGIKCHEWTGKEYYQNDDDKNECFRKYKSAEDSYIDHTDFLMNSPRYVFLFYLNQTDYRRWAKGLEKAGYATNRSYAKDLIRIIEENNLSVYDQPQKKRKKREELVYADQTEMDQTGPDEGKADQTEVEASEEFEVEVPHRRILTRNRINYIIVLEGDTYLGITEEFKMMPFELARYNEIERNATLEPGKVLYLQPKRNKASVEFRYHTVAEGETMYQISQMYGIRLHKLYQKNLMKEGTEPEVGDVLWLRIQKKAEETSPPVEKIPGIEFE